MRSSATRVAKQHDPTARVLCRAVATLTTSNVAGVVVKPYFILFFLQLRAKRRCMRWRLLELGELRGR
jgi:hypothetical protein